MTDLKYSKPAIFFYPHPYLRDRHLDTIRKWPKCEVASPDRSETEKGVQVSKEKSIRGAVIRSWKQLLPLVNLKRRPTEAPVGSIVYVWGALVHRGRFITDLDNPYSLVGYNTLAMTLWRPVIGMFLRSERCIQIRCLSEACRTGVRRLFGEQASLKAVVVYPSLDQKVLSVKSPQRTGPRLLFIGTQFEIKGGPELLRAFRHVRKSVPDATLDIITHLPDKYLELSEQPGVTVHAAVFSRDQIWSRFMSQADVLVHPSYMESFGMVIMEALSHGLAVVANDVYAHREMVFPGENGELLEPPVKYWDNDQLAGPLFRHQHRAAEYIREVDMEGYVQQLADTIVGVIENPSRLLAMRNQSCEIFSERFREGRVDQVQGFVCE